MLSISKHIYFPKLWSICYLLKHSLVISEWCALGVYLNGSGSRLLYISMRIAVTVFLSNCLVSIRQCNIVGSNNDSRSWFQILFDTSLFWSCCFKLVFFPIIFKLMDDQFVVTKTSHLFTHSGEHFLLAYGFMHP